MPEASVMTREALEELQNAYPLRPARLAHALSDHPLFALDRLAAAAARLDTALVETKRATHLAGALEPVDRQHHSTDAFVRAVDKTQAWTMLRFIDRLPEYRALLARVMREIADIIEPLTGAASRARAFVFISSPGTITPFHVDPEYNVLFHIKGTKRITLFPAETCLPQAADEALHGDGRNLLAWDDRYAADAQSFDLVPGDAVFVPYKWPHHVVVGDTSAISVSMTWQSAWTETQPPLHRMNARLARLGARRMLLPRWPHVPRAALLAARLTDRIARR